MRTRWMVAGLAAVAVLATGEVLSWRASTDDLGHADGEGDEAIVVLGFPSRRHDAPGWVQRYRTRIAVRSRRPAPGRRSVLVFTGRSPHRPTARSEAAVMADYAVDHLGVDRADVVLEEEAQSTWENVARVLPLVEPFGVIRIASDTFHARKARRYLRRQAPEVAERLQRAADYRPGELVLLKPVLAATNL